MFPFWERWSLKGYSYINETMSEYEIV